MARYCANRPNRTVVLHKDSCHHVHKSSVSVCGCGSTSDQDNTVCYCEEHVTIDGVSDFMRGRVWAVLPCGKCYGGE